MILVTGGTGLLGRFVVRELQGRGKAVRILARAGSAQKAEETGAQVAVGDLGDAESLRQAMRGVAGIIHTACTFTQPAVDVSAMEALLDAWEMGPLVFISSVDVYGYVQDIPVLESHPLNGHSSYAQGKQRNEQLLQEAAKERGRSDFSILRPPYIWGPVPRTGAQRGSSAFGLVERVRAGKTIVLPGATLEECQQFGDDWIDARELAWAAAECLEHPLGEAANAVNSHFLWYDFCSELIRLTESASRIEPGAPTTGVFAQRWQYSGELLRQRLGFRPSYRWQDTWAEIVPPTPQR